MSKTTEYHRVTTAYTVLPKGAELFDELATTVRMDDEGGGAFVVLEQTHDHSKKGQVRLDMREWPAVRDAVEAMQANILAMELVEIIVPEVAK